MYQNFGLKIDSVEFKVYLIDEKIQKIIFLCELILEQKPVKIRKLAKCFE